MYQINVDIIKEIGIVLFGGLHLRLLNNEWPTLLPDKFNERVTILCEIQHSSLKNPLLQILQIVAVLWGDFS